jgi:hypothetical protein
VHEGGRGKRKNTAYVCGLTRRHDVEVAVVELGGDVLVRAGTRRMRRRQVGRKEWKRAHRETSVSRRLGKRWVLLWQGRVGNLQARRRSDSEIYCTLALFARPPTPLHPGPRLAGFPSDGSARAGTIPYQHGSSTPETDLAGRHKTKTRKQASKGRHIQLTIYFPPPLPNTRLSHSASFSVLMYRSS